MHCLVPHLLQRLRLTGLALSWLSLALLLTVASVMIIEQSVYVELSSESANSGAWQHSSTYLYWSSPRLEIHHSLTTRFTRDAMSLDGVVRKLEFRRGIWLGSSVLHSINQHRPAYGVIWDSPRNMPGVTDHEWALALHWPYPLLLLALPAWPALCRIYRWLIRRYRIPATACPVCGYDLTATPHRCPECGATVTIDPQAGRYRLADPHPRRVRRWLARIWMANSIITIIAVLVIWNGPGGTLNARGRGPHLWLLQHQAICWYQYATPGNTRFIAEWHPATLGLWAQLDSSTLVLWIPYWFPLAIASIAPLRAFWRRIRCGPVPGRTFSVSSSPASSASSPSTGSRSDAHTG